MVEMKGSVTSWKMWLQSWPLSLFCDSYFMAYLSEEGKNTKPVTLLITLPAFTASSNAWQWGCCCCSNTSCKRDQWMHYIAKPWEHTSPGHQVLIPTTHLSWKVDATEPFLPLKKIKSSCSLNLKSPCNGHGTFFAQSRNGGHTLYQVMKLDGPVSEVNHYWYIALLWGPTCTHIM